MEGTVIIGGYETTKAFLWGFVIGLFTIIISKTGYGLYNEIRKKEPESTRDINLSDNKD